MMLGKARVDGRFARYFLIASLMHAALAYVAVLQVSGWATNGVLAYFAVATTRPAHFRLDGGPKPGTAKLILTN